MEIGNKIYNTRILLGIICYKCKLLIDCNMYLKQLWPSRHNLFKTL